MKKLIYTFLLVGFYSVAFAQDKDLIKYAETITKDDLKKHLSILASDEYEGRETGKKGQKMAAKYLQKQLEEFGILGGVKQTENPYLQTFNLIEKSWADVYLKTKTEHLKHLEDFIVYGKFDYPEETEVEIIFAGYGLDTKEYSDYKALDVKDKIVVVMRGEPKNKKGKYLISGTDESNKTANLSYKYMTAMEKGAKGMIAVYPSNADYQQTLNTQRKYLAAPALGFAEKAKKHELGVILTSPTSACKMLGIVDKKLFKAIKKINKKGESQAGLFSAKIKLKVNRPTKTVSTENILAFMEGTDKKDEILVITAHYDHIGIIDGEINNGADDDGSGTVSVLEIAQAFAKAKADGKAPRRSILFMWFTGEEKGLLGSEYYANNPIYPMEKVITNLNIDMVGRVDEDHQENPNYIYIIGSTMLSTDLHKLSEKTAKTYLPEIQLDYKYNDKNDPNRFYYRSDHYNFAKNNIPVIFYFNGTHPDYHQPGDDVEKIHFDKMEKVARLIFATAWELANGDKAPVVDKADENSDK